MTTPEERVEQMRAVRHWVDTVDPEHVYEQMGYHASCGCPLCRACMTPADRAIYDELDDPEPEEQT